MLSLIVTALLGLFCCSSFTYNSLDQSKEIEIHQSLPKNSVHQGVFYGFSMTDIFNENGLNSMLSYLRETNSYTGSNWGLEDTGTTNDQLLGEYSFSVSSCTLYTFSSRDNLGNNTPLADIDFFTIREHYYQTSTSHALLYDCWFYRQSQTVVYGRWYVYRNIDTLDINNGLLIFTEYWYTPVGSQTSTRNADIFFTTYDLDQLGRMFGSVVNLSDTGFANARHYGYELGKQDGEQIGYANALNDMSDTSSTALTIFTGFIEVGLLPVNVFLQILNFDVFGINIAGFVSAILTVSIVIIIVRFLLGGKSDD